MEFSLFSATGCMRCNIVKSYMKDNSISYQEFDFKADGKDEFNTFYRKNRPHIFRGKEGVEFPILFDGEKVIQGVGVIIAFFKEKRLLEGSVARSDLSHGWVSGLNISSLTPDMSDDFLAVIEYLRSHGLKTLIETDGRNSEVLSRLVDNSLVDRLDFKLKGPAGLYEEITGTSLDETGLEYSLTLAGKCPEYQIILPLEPFLRSGGQRDIIAPEEASKAAAFVEKATGSKTHPFFIKKSIPADEADTITKPNLFKYRTACRRYMVKTDILKD